MPHRPDQTSNESLQLETSATDAQPEALRRSSPVGLTASPKARMQASRLLSLAAAVACDKSPKRGKEGRNPSPSPTTTQRSPMPSARSNGKHEALSETPIHANSQAEGKRFRESTEDERNDAGRTVKAMITPSPASKVAQKRNRSADVRRDDATESVVDDVNKETKHGDEKDAPPTARRLHPFGAPRTTPPTPPTSELSGPPHLSIYGTSKLTTSPIRVKKAGGKARIKKTKDAATKAQARASHPPPPAAEDASSDDGGSAAQDDSSQPSQTSHNSRKAATRTSASESSAQRSAKASQKALQKASKYTGAASDNSESNNNAHRNHHQQQPHQHQQSIHSGRPPFASEQQTSVMLETPAPPSIRRMTHPTHLHYAPSWSEMSHSHPHARLVYHHPSSTPLAYYGRMPPAAGTPGALPHHMTYAMGSGITSPSPVTPSTPALGKKRPSSPSPQLGSDIPQSKKARVVSDGSASSSTTNTSPVAELFEKASARVRREAEASAQEEPGAHSGDDAEEESIAAILAASKAKRSGVHADLPHHAMVQYAAPGPAAMMHAAVPPQSSPPMHHLVSHGHPGLPPPGAHHSHYVYAYQYAAVPPPYRSPYGHMPPYAAHPSVVPNAHPYYPSIPTVSAPGVAADASLERRASAEKEEATASRKTTKPQPAAQGKRSGAAKKQAASPLQQFASVSEWQRVASESGGRAPSTNRCEPLKEPIPSKYWGEADKTKDLLLPDFHRLVNFPDYLARPRNSSRTPGGPKPDNLATPDGKKHCVMCGKLRVCSAASLVSKNADKSKKAASSNAASAGKDEADCSGHIIPRQNKGLCTSCDVTVWVITENGLEIKWCKGCKNFRPWAAFGEKGSATKCVRCRQRQREKYAMQKGGTKAKRYVRGGAKSKGKKSAATPSKARSTAAEDHLAAITGLQNLRKATTA